MITLIVYIIINFYVKSEFGQYCIFWTWWLNWYNFSIFGQVRSICAWFATLLNLYCDVGCWNEFWGFQINLFDVLFLFCLLYSDSGVLFLGGQNFIHGANVKQIDSDLIFGTGFEDRNFTFNVKVKRYSCESRYKLEGFLSVIFPE